MNRLGRLTLRWSFALALTLVLAVSTVAAETTISVRMETALGSISVDLYPDKAPLTVANFLRYVDGGYFDGASFYRTVSYDNDRGAPKIEVIQGGIGGDAPFEPIAHESTEATGLSHEDGTISMARGAVGTADSEFFIVLGAQPGLDKGAPRNADEQGFAAFGKVVEGMEVVRKIHRQPANATSDSEYTKGQIMDLPVEISTVRRISAP